MAFIERRHDSALTEQEVVEACGRMMASFKVHRRVIFRTTWPLTESGKIQKFQLKQAIGDGGGAGSGTLVGKSG